MAFNRVLVNVLPQKFLGVLPLFIGVEIILGIAILNKASGLYGILSLLTGHPINFLQWLYNMIALLILPFYAMALINLKNKPRNVRKLSLATLIYILDTGIGCLYTLYFTYYWFYVEDTDATINARRDTVDDDLSRQSASQTRELFITFSTTVVITVVRFYFTLVMVSFTRLLLKQHISEISNTSGEGVVQHNVDEEEEEILGSTGMIGEVKKAVLDLELRSKEFLIRWLAQY